MISITHSTVVYIQLNFKLVSVNFHLNDSVNGKGRLVLVKCLNPFKQHLAFEIMLKYQMFFTICDGCNVSFFF